jgi:hypothetical protein
LVRLKKIESRTVNEEGYDHHSRCKRFVNKDLIHTYLHVGTGRRIIWSRVDLWGAHTSATSVKITAGLRIVTRSFREQRTIRALPLGDRPRGSHIALL